MKVKRVKIQVHMGAKVGSNRGQAEKSEKSPKSKEDKGPWAYHPTYKHPSKLLYFHQTCKFSIHSSQYTYISP